MSAKTILIGVAILTVLAILFILFVPDREFNDDNYPTTGHERQILS